MTVRVDKPGEHRHLRGVDDLRSRRLKIPDIRIRPDGEEATILDGEGLGARARGVLRQHAPIHHDQIGVDTGTALRHRRKLGRLGAARA